MALGWETAGKGSGQAPGVSERGQSAMSGEFASQFRRGGASSGEAAVSYQLTRWSKTSSGTQPVIVVHLLSPDARYDTVYLRNYATLHIKDELVRLSGVGQVWVYGAGDYSMRILLDPGLFSGTGTVFEQARKGGLLVESCSNSRAASHSACTPVDLARSRSTIG